MIIPLRLPNGLPDISRLDQWPAVCDRCGKREPFRNCAEWLISRTADAPVYCPPCVARIAAKLIRAALPLQRRVAVVLAWRVARMRGGQR